LGIEVLGVSYDSPEKNRKFAEKNGLPFRLLSDSDRELAQAVGAARALLPFAKRVSYLVGPDGVVLKAYPDVSPKTHAQEVLEDYRGLIADAQ
jgi:peroxiredoxin Q/BCP